ncbi:DMT family transporter [Mesorhizobium koreense]|uniref:DMT family transporter n=1 Tax=Mesorhizobium koreense TaxID=3074855 RepID=UPI00287BA0E5|nr:DMT family transporter [Mesorhizobium sp. WR6]
MKVVILVSVAMLAFAANSILARLALSESDIDPLAYTGIRLVAGAVVLAAIALFRAAPPKTMRSAIKGSWSGAICLLLYALAFSVAYVMVGAGPGALILFASVQIGMLAWAIVKGDRPAPLEWLGMGVAFAALVYLVSPGLVAPPLKGALLMVVAGLAWGAYSLIGRGSRAPVADTAGNFARCAPVGLLLIAIGVASVRPNAEGLAYAVASGALASGLGYIVWYGVLPSLSRTQAAFVQLSVPAIAAAGGIAIIGEPLTARLLIATAGIVGGIALALLAAERRRRMPNAGASRRSA